MTCMLMATMTLASAQTLVKANFQKGDTAIYEGSAKIEMAAQGQAAGSATLNLQNRFVVKEVNADGYVIENTLLKADTDGANTGNPGVDMMVQSMTMLKGYTVIFGTDTNGKIIKVFNMDKVKAHTDKFFAEIVDDLYAKNPVLAQNMPKEELVSTMSAEVTEEKLVEEMNKINSVFSLYGKLLVTGDTAKEVAEGIKFNTVYTVNSLLGKMSVIAHSVSDMDEEAVKQMFFSQIEKAGLPNEQVEQMKAAYPMLAASGLAKVEMINDATYIFQKNGWVDQLKTVADANTFGTTLKVTTSTGIKYINRK